MVQRVHLSSNPPRLITSKAGKNATPTMPDADKSFDSNWFDGGGLKWILKVNNQGAVTFPYPLSYIPYVWGFTGGNLWNGDNNVFDASWFSSQDKPPANNCILMSDWYQRPGMKTTVSTTGVGSPNAGGNNMPVNFWMVFEG